MGTYQATTMQTDKLYDTVPALKIGMSRHIFEAKLEASPC